MLAERGDNTGTANPELREGRAVGYHRRYATRLVPRPIDYEEVNMGICRWTTVLFFVVIGFAVTAASGDLVVDGAVATTGGWYGFADGSTQSSAAYPRWAQVAVVDIMGRGDYSDPVAAMGALTTWCGTPSESNPCLVKVLPGHYDIGSSTVIMQPYVAIEGSGRNVTYLRSASGNAVVNVPDNAELRALTVVNDGDGGYPRGISIGGDVQPPRVTNVDVVVSGANDDNTGVVLSDSEPIIDSMRVYVTGGDYATGIRIANSAGLLQNVDVHVTTVAGSVATGIVYSLGSTAVLKNSRVYAADCYTTNGIRSSNSSPVIEDVAVVVEADHFGYGFQNLSSTVTLTDTSIEVKGGVNATGLSTASAAVSTVRGVHIDVGEATTGNTGVATQDDASVRLEQVSITATGGNTAHAIGNWEGAEATLINVTAEASGASSFSYGVYNDNSSLLDATNLVVEASGGTSYAVRNGSSGGTVTIDRSSLTGGTNSADNDSSSADFFVGNSKLDGPVGADLTCFGNYDATYAAVTCP
jgi:hypothetical protein